MEFIKDLKNEISNYKDLEKFFEFFDLNKVNNFYIFLKENAQKGGFFSKLDLQKIASRHVLESIVYIDYIKRFFNVSRETSVIDVGTGPGIPGFLFYCLKEPPKLTLLDSSKRRLKLLENFVKEKSYFDIQFIYERVENLKGKFDFATIRALIPFPFNAKLSSLVFKKFLFIFSGNIQINEKILEYLSQSNLKIEKIIPINELNFLGERKLIIISHIDNLKKMNPINWKNIQREMKKWEV